jgi:AraC-like DNA-binding protein
MIHLYFQWHTLELANEAKLGILERFYSTPNEVRYQPFSIENIVGTLQFYGHRFFYFFYALHLLSKSKQEIQYAEQSRTQFIRLLSVSLIGYCVIWGSLRLMVFIPNIGAFVMANSNIINSTGLILTVSFVANFCFTYPIKDIFSKKSTQKYQKSYIGDDLNREIFDQIKQLISQPSIYANPNLKLPELAKLSGFSTHQISQAININNQSNFNGLLNDYRVEQVKCLLAEHSNREKDILELAFQAGFNSKATFNREFKKRVELTPRQFRATLI